MFAGVLAMVPPVIGVGEEEGENARRYVSYVHPAATRHREQRQSGHSGMASGW